MVPGSWSWWWCLEREAAAAVKPKKLQANQPRTAKPTSTTDRQGLHLVESIGLSDCRLPGHSIGQQRKTPNGSQGRLRHASALEPKWMPWQQPTESHGSATKVRMRRFPARVRERQGKDGQRRASTGGPTPRDDGIRGPTGL